MMKCGQDMDGKVFRHFCLVVTVLRASWCTLFILQQQVICSAGKAPTSSKSFTREYRRTLRELARSRLRYRIGEICHGDNSRHGDAASKVWNLAICRGFLARGNFKVFGNMCDNHLISMLMKL